MSCRHLLVSSLMWDGNHVPPLLGFLMWILGTELMSLNLQGKHNFTDGAISSALVSVFTRGEKEC